MRGTAAKQWINQLNLHCEFLCMYNINEYSRHFYFSCASQAVRSMMGVYSCRHCTVQPILRIYLLHFDFIKHQQFFFFTCWVREATFCQTNRRACVLLQKLISNVHKRMQMIFMSDNWALTRWFNTVKTENDKSAYRIHCSNYYGKSVHASEKCI